MAKKTLLQMVKSIMSDLDSDEITAVTDTVESQQVVSTLRDIYDQMVTNQMIPEFKEILHLGTVNLTDHPLALNYLEIPDTVSVMNWFQYDKQQDGDTSEAYAQVDYISPAQFMQLVSKNASDADNVVQVTDPTSSVQYYVVNDKAPRWWTTFDDHYIALDSFDQAVDTVHVLGTKTRAEVQRIPSWTDANSISDTFVPDMDENLFAFLVAEAKSTCFANLKQMANVKVEKQALEQRIRLQAKKHRTRNAQKESTGSTGPNYGRR